MQTRPGVLNLSLAAGLALVLLGAGGVPAADGAAVSPEKVKYLEGLWNRLQRDDPRRSSRAFFDFALEAVEADWRADAVETALTQVERMQDRDEQSKTYGNLCWYWQDAEPDDRNAVEFCMQKGALVWMRHRDRLTPRAQEALRRLMRYGIEGIRRHHVRESYTNIFLMKTWNCIALGEAIGDSRLAAEGYALFDRWLLYTWACGIHEYLSPTYYGVDLDSLGLIARFAGREVERAKAKAALRLFWYDIVAHWDMAGQRLGGAHSRDYDYLTGHGYLDHYLQASGWEPAGTRSANQSAFAELTAWPAPRDIVDAVAARCPRMVHQRWGHESWMTATHYAGRDFGLGSAGGTYGPMDKPLVLSLPGTPKTAQGFFFMDARNDPYGSKRFAAGGGHQKALHIEPFLMSAQRGADVLMLASAGTDTPAFKRMGNESIGMFSHVVLPADVEVWSGENRLSAGVEGGASPVTLDTRLPVFLRFGNVVAGLRVLAAVATDGGAAPVTLVRDDTKKQALRITCTHAAKRPEGRGTFAFRLSVTEGLNDGAFARFRQAFAAAAASATRQADGTFVVTAANGDDPLRLVMRLEQEERLEVSGADFPGKDTLLAVDGRDVGREQLLKLEPVTRWRGWDGLVTNRAVATSAADCVVEAEHPAACFAPFETGRAEAASAGGFLWMPGSALGQGGSEQAKAAWRFDVPAGRYSLWARVRTPTPEDDSFYVAVRGAGGVLVDRVAWHTGVHADWTWRRVAGCENLALPAGALVVEFHCREDGAGLDALYLASGAASPPGVK